jgi:hypothetical protein
MVVMADQPVFRVDISPDVPKAVVFGADTFVGQAFLGQLLGSNLQVIAVARDPQELEKRQRLVVTTQSGLEKVLPQQVEYIIDFSSSQEALSLAGRKHSRFIRLLDLEQKEVKPFDYPLSDWRIVKTAFVYGPTLHLKPLTVINQLILQAVFNLPLKMPPLKSQFIFPVYIADLVQAISKVLFSPGLSQQEVLVLGNKIKLEEAVEQVKQEAKVAGKLSLSDHFLSLPNFLESEVTSQWQLIDWEPQTSFPEGLAKTVQFFFQKMEKRELKKEEWGGKQEQPSEVAKSEPVAAEFWEAASIKPSPKKTRLKKKRLKKNKVVEAHPPLPVSSKPKEEKEELVIDEDTEEIDTERRVAKQEVVEIAEEKSKKEDSKLPARWLSHLLVLAGTVLAVFLIRFWLPVFFFLLLGSYQLKLSLGQFMNKEWTKAAASSLEAARFYTDGEFISASGRQQSVYKFFLLGKELGRTVHSASVLANEAFGLLPEILGSAGSGYDSEKGRRLATYINKLDGELAILQADLNGSLAGIPARWRNRLVDSRGKIKDAREALAKAGRLLPFSDWILGVDKERTFLVLLQNNNELRATGGFIGSFALLRFNHGKLADFEVKDVYWADGQLKGHVNPPKPLLGVVGDGGWYLRDSNWDPDFPKSAKTASWFLKKEIGVESDGVIAFNLRAAQILLSQLGEVYLPDFNEKINSANLFERAEFYSETNFFPGSTQKMTFLGSLGKQLFEEVKTADPQKQLMVAKAFYQALEEKEIMVWAKNEKLNQALVRNNWQGEIKQPLSSKHGGFSDYLMIVESNVGVNKANYFLRRGIEEMVKITADGQISHDLKIQYENTSQSNKWPGGDYKNFLRLYLPWGTKLAAVYIWDPLDSQAVKMPLSEDQIEQKRSGDKLEVSFSLTVPVSARRLVEIEFSQKAKIEGKGFYYARYWQKQSGFGSTPLTFLVAFPSGWQPLQVNPAATVTEGGLVFQQQLRSDTVFGVNWSY